VIDAVLRRHGAPGTREVAKLTPRLVELSQAYNKALAGDGARVKVPLDARIAFSFARDVPKGAGAVRELVRAGALKMRPDHTLRMVDVGAGLGAMTWGIARALTRSGGEPVRIEALLVDEDAEALKVAESIGREAVAQLGVDGAALTIRTQTAKIAVGMKLPEADLVVLGQVLSELDVAMDPAERATKHAALITDLLERVVAPDGALVVVEPALRDRTRHLHAVRDLLALRGTTIFAPCLHASGCPVLTTMGDWCHEDLPVDLPAWVVPLARAAGLRWQGLTFSHLVLRRDGRRLVDEVVTGAEKPGDPPRVHLRVISELMRTKGKAEVFACTSGGERLRMRRLDRDASESGPGAAATATWGRLGRGDVVTISGGDAQGDPADVAPTPPIDERGRLSVTAQIDVWPSRK
jgi:ribosomal protein RSM22 (predicted rRNA methylase)